MRDGAALRVRGLVKRYGAFEAVGGIDLTVEMGQAFGLLGPNGSGKTTTLACALGLLEASEGTVEVLGAPSHRLHTLGGRLAAVFDSPALLPGHTIRQNLAYQRRLRGHTGALSEDAALALVGLAGLEKRRAGNLSLGQRKRLSLAGALAGSPELIVLDEPLSGLDPMGVRDVMQLFAELRDRGMTLVVSSHRLHEMQELLTDCAVIHKGRLLHSGPLAPLLGDERSVVVRVDDPARAKELLRDRCELVPPAEYGPHTSRRNGEPGTSLTVRSDELDAAAIAQRLVEGGVRLHGLRPARRGLQAAFEALVDREAKRLSGAASGGAA